MPNTLTNVRFGRYSASAETARNIVTNTIVATTFKSKSQNVWLHTINGFVAAQDSGDPFALRFGAYLTTTGITPGSRRAFTVNQNVSSETLSLYSLAIEGTDSSPLETYAMIPSGQNLVLTVRGLNGAFKISKKDNSTNFDDNIRYDLGVSSYPTTFVVDGTYTEESLTIYADGWANVVPTAVTSPVAPVNASSINSLTPTFTVNFLDLNGAYGASSGNGVDCGDYVSQYQINLREQGTTTLLWNQTFTASTAEQTADQISVVYSGSSLSRGNTYEWRIRFKDAFGEWSAYNSTWFTFFINEFGTITLQDDPTSSIDSVTPDFEGRWTHVSATTMKEVQVRLLDQNGSIIQTGAMYNITDVASSAAPGTLFTIPWANTGLSTLQWGRTYKYQMQGTDGTQLSGWSDARTFSTDSAPSIPTIISPNTGVARPTYPLLRVTVTDADDDVTTLTVKAIITRPDASTTTVTLAYNSTEGTYELQLTGTEVTMEGTYNWEPYAGDGVLWSGGVVAEGSASKALGVFYYATAPTVTIMSPLDGSTINTSSPIITWTAANQAEYLVFIVDSDTAETVFWTGGGNLIAGAGQTLPVPPGWIRDGHNYTVFVSVKNTAGVSGSTASDFTVSITPPDSVTNFQVSPEQLSTDPWPTAIRISWDQSLADAEHFVEYTLYRSASGGLDAAEVILARMPQTVLEYVDYGPASGFEYTYYLRVVVNEDGLNDIESDAVEGSAQVDLEGVVLHSVRSPSAYRSILHYRVAGDPLGREWRRRRPESLFGPLSGGTPRSILSASRWWEGTVEAVLIDDEWATATTRAAEVEALETGEGDEDQSTNVICARDDRGRKRFCVIPDNGITIIDRRPIYYEVRVDLREERYTEGDTL